MPELIDKQAVRLLESDADAYTENWNDDYEKGFCDAINKALELPTIEPEVRHGRWIECDYKHMEHGMIETEPKAGLCCSECRTAFQKKKMTYKQYCAACGAKMRLRTPTETQLDEADSVMMGGADNGNG